MAQKYNRHFSSLRNRKETPKGPKLREISKTGTQVPVILDRGHCHSQ